MPAAQTAPVEPVLNLNDPLPPKRDRGFLAFLSLVFVFSSTVLLYLLFKNPSSNLGQIFQKFPAAKNKVEISQKELDQAYRLEKILNFPDVDLTKAVNPPVSSVSNLPKDFKPPDLTTILKDLAKERVLERKILEREAHNLKIDLSDIKREAAKIPPNSPRGGVVPDNLVAVFAYDKALVGAVQQKIEGGVWINSVLVTTTNSQLKEAAAKVAQNLFETLKNPPVPGVASKSAEVNPPVNPNVLVSMSQEFLIGSASANFKSDKQVNLGPTPFGLGYYFKIVSGRDSGLGMSFEEWFASMKKKYIL